MSEETIKLRLDELSEVTLAPPARAGVSARDIARIDYQTARYALIPQEIQIALADLDAEFTLRDAAIALNIEELEKEIKQAVLVHGASVKGMHLHAVYNRPRVIWDTRGLDRYAAQHPEVVIFRSEGDASVAIRKI
ncbi:MAG: hypothetical protein HZB51_13870 [Chloroflexi bacterium]|nr:hypothetical protein [Chloroflexota bacterium]